MKEIKGKKDFWDELTQSQKEEIEQGIKDIDEGRVISWESFLIKLKKNK